MMKGFQFEGSQGFQFDHESFDDRNTPRYVVPVGFSNGDGSILNDDSPVDFSEFQPDIDLNFISRILMEEDVEEKIYMLQGDAALVAAAEKPFHDILAKNHLPVSPVGPLLNFDFSESSEYSADVGGKIFNGVVNGHGSNYVVDGWEERVGQQMYPQIHVPVGYREPETDNFISLYLDNKQPGGLEDHLFGTVHPLFGEDQHVWQFDKERVVEEASKFPPDSSQHLVNLTSEVISEPWDLMPRGEASVVKVEGEREQAVVNETRGVKNHNHGDYELEEGRSVKHLAAYSGDHVPKEMYDEVLLCDMLWNCDLNSIDGRSVQPDKGDTVEYSEPKISNGGRSKNRKQTKKDAVDLRSLLVLCAQSIAADDRLSATEQLKQIRQHSCSTGDGSQRMAHYFADGLEARLSGIGSEIYHSHMAKCRTSAADILKAFRVYMSACPFKKVAHVYANQLILSLTRKVKKIHIIDFGIGFGFHWPCLIQNLSTATSGSPMLRITGVDFPQPGFRPSERLEETGRRLADYAREFNVPFEYHQIASKWENVRVEDLDIREGEFLVVFCMHTLKDLADETVTVESPRNIVLNNIRRMNPSVFIHGVVNGAYSSPFFVARFREALFHFSALFDVFDCNIPREDPDRVFWERMVLGQEVLNVVACEFTERVHRPETYKQWQVRNQRCGFKQLPLNPDILKFCTEKIMPRYDKNFFIDTDGKWMLQGWKGRVLFALSTWTPTTTGV